MSAIVKLEQPPCHGTEEALVEAAKRGDTHAFRELYQNNAETIFRYLHTRLGFHEAEDVTAEVFCTAWRKLSSYQWTGIPFRGWLLTIAKNLVRGRARRDAVVAIRPTIDGEIPGDLEAGADEKALRHTDAVDILRALKALKPGSQAVLRHRFLEELSVKEVADKLNCSEENVRTRTFRALSELRSLTAGSLK